MTLSLTILIIIGTAIVSYLSFQNDDLYRKLIMNPVAVTKHGQWYRMITSGFIHANLPHLAFNMFTLYFFGRNVEYIFQYHQGPLGSIYFIIFYISAIVISDLVTVYKNKDNGYYNSLGASGGVSAIVFCSILFYPTDDICMYGFICLPGFILGIFYLIYSYMKSDSFSDNINHDAHLYGALYGLVFSVIIYPNVLSEFFRQVMNWRLPF